VNRKVAFLTVIGVGLTLVLVAGMGIQPAQGAAQVQAQEPDGMDLERDVSQVLAGNAFTYQGYLTDGGSPANGLYDFSFSLYADAGGTQWVTDADPVDNVNVVDGLFTVPVDVTEAGLGDVYFYLNGDARYLQIGVRPGASTGAYTHLSPLQPLTPAPYALALPGMNTVQNATSTNVIGGYSWNYVDPNVVGAAIGGGGHNGGRNEVYGDYATVGGGRINDARQDDDTVGGGASNTADGGDATVGGGEGNTAGAACAVVAGGCGNVASDTSATVGGGDVNYATAEQSTIAGGSGNSANGPSSTIGGGSFNSASAEFASIAGGDHNDITASYGTIGGGGGPTAADGNRVTDPYGTVGGGYQNHAGNGNIDMEDAHYATIGGGYGNEASNVYTAVGGGEWNEASGIFSTIGGGQHNIVSGGVATIAGGSLNEATQLAATVGGGSSNLASGSYSTVPGGDDNTAQGDYSFAAGRHARANYDGCFVWGDNSTTNDVACYGPDRTIFRNAGGIWIYTNAGLSTGVWLSAGSSSWNTVSDRQAKENFRAIDARMLLARLAEIPVSTWNYKAQDPSIRHLGPMAQDFNSLVEDLGGEGETYISTVDADGVALAAIQGLYQLAQEQSVRIEALQAERAAQGAQVSALRAEMEDLEARLSALEQGSGVTQQPPDTKAVTTWLLLPGLIVVVGLVLQQRRSGGSR
jgi:hypothetical protein